MNDAAKENLIAQFRAYLDANDASELVSRLDGSREPDLFSVFGELVALKNEVRLGTRQVKAALEQFGEVFNTLRANNERLDGELTRRRDNEQQAHRTAQRALLIGILDLRERLEAGVISARDHRPGLLFRLSGRDRRFMGALSEGMEMSLARLDEMLNRHGVRPLTVVGAPFDPHTMRAVGLEHEQEQPDGIVIAELRKGFVWGEEIARQAEVVVNKKQTQDE